MAASTASRTNSRVNYSNEIHDLSTVQSGSAVPTLFYPDKSIADIFPPHLGKKVRTPYITDPSMPSNKSASAG